MIEVAKGPTLPKQSLREWVLQARRSARSAEAVDRYSEILKALDAIAARKAATPDELPPEPGPTPELETVASAEGAAGETMDQVRKRPRNRRNVARPTEARKASRIVKRLDKEERYQRNQRDAAAEKAAAKKARKGGRKQLGPAPMTPAERVKAYRERMRAAKGSKTGGKRGRKKS